MANALVTNRLDILSWCLCRRCVLSAGEFKFPANVIQSPVPPAKQVYLAGCGAAVMRSIFRYWGIRSGCERTVMSALGTTINKGTRPAFVAKYARECNLNAKLYPNSSWDLIKENLSYGYPIICNIQAWGTQEKYEKLMSGHYVVIIGLTKDRVIFQDPMLSGFRGTLTITEFESRWKDLDWDGRIYRRMAIPVWSDRNPSCICDRSKAKEIV